MYVGSAKGALAREIWNKVQLEDALNSAEFFIKKAKFAAGLDSSGGAS